jgi:protein-tyrosine phosphatase
MGEGIMRYKLEERNIPAEVDSCGFEQFHVGDPPDHRAISVMRSNGIDITFHRARLFKPNDLIHFDHIFVMDHSHYRNIMKYVRNDAERKRVDFILNAIAPGQNHEVDDPWYHDIHAFEKVYRQLDHACEIIAGKIMKNIPL